jgi:ParB family chromosome partitioning protein
MTYEEKNEPDPDIPTVASAKKTQKKIIARLRKGDTEDRKRAELISQCREGHRCQLDECALCERRELKKQRASASAVDADIGSLAPRAIRLTEITVADERRPPNEEQVGAMAASMNLVGLRTPLTVRVHKKKKILVTGHVRLAAAKQLDWDTIPCVELRGDKTDARIWQLTENLYRGELTALDRAEHVDELRLLVLGEGKGGQVAPPPGGLQPQEVGINKSAKALGLTREEIRRSKTVAALSPAVKAEARELGLDDNQRALLEIAKQPAEAQSRIAKAIAERRRATGNGNAAADKKATAESGITRGHKNESASDRKRRREINDKQEAVDEVASPATTPTGDGDIPAFLDRRPLPAEDQRALDLLQAAWDTHVQPLLNGVSPVVRERFKAAILQANTSSCPSV